MTHDIDSLLDQAYAMLDHRDAPRAYQLFRQVVELAPDNAEAWLMSGALEGEAGNFSAALPSIERAVELDPDYLGARLTLAHLYQRLGKNDLAIAQAREATRIDPKDSEAWLLLSGLFGQAADYVAAEDAATNALASAPDPAQALVNLASAQRGLGKLEQAAGTYRKALALDGRMAEALVGLGNTLLALWRPGDALEPLRTASKAMPGNAEVREFFGRALLATGNVRDALSELRESVRLAPTQERHLYLATALEYNDRPREAAEYLNGALQPAGEADRHAYAARGAAILHRAGDSQAAWALLQPQIDSRTLSPEAVETYARLCDEFGSCEEAADLLERAIDSPDVDSPEIRRGLLFALGHLRDRQMRYDDAFEAFEQANALSTAPYRPEAYVRYVDRLIAVLTPERMLALPASAQVSDRPIFIVGMPRSGSSLVEQILASHPDVHGGGELYGIFNAVSALEKQYGCDSYPECLASVRREDLSRIADEYLELLAAIDATAKRVTDKMPHNFQHLALIHAMFPNAAIVHVTRDPLDTCLSCFTIDFAGQHGYSSNLAHLGSHYRQYQRLMAHYRDRLGIPMQEIAYESLVSEPAAAVAALLEYCRLPWNDACLKPHENRRLVRTASYEQVRRPIHAGATGRWKHYDAHLSELKAALAR